MTWSLLGLCTLLLLPTLAWWRYCQVAGESAAASRPEQKHLQAPYPAVDWQRAHHQRGVKWLHDIFQRSAARFPDYPALQVPHSGEFLTYRQLQHRSDQFAAAIRPYLTGPDQVVAVGLAQDCADCVAAHLGVLKAGGTQLYLDPEAPPGLVELMLEDAKPTLLLGRGEPRGGNIAYLDIDTLGADQPTEWATPDWLDNPQDRLAALFYTSGTTGKPKGVECHHGGYINLARSYADYFDLCAGMDATTLTSSLGYDGSISELYSAWTVGAAVVLLTKEQVRSGPDLVPILREQEVTALFCPPVLLSTLTDAPQVDLPYPICRYVIPAGEAFPANLVGPWSRGRRQIINTYGPTEASTDTSRQLLRPGRPVTIGTPFPGVLYAVVDPKTLQPLSRGNEGELVIGGCHLARGYRNLPEVTGERFVQHPELGRLYRTGDRAKIHPLSGEVHFLGRLDHQVKVRGHRVEVQGLESFLQDRIPEIEAAIVSYQDGNLWAFLVAPDLPCPGEADGAVAALDPPWSSRLQRQLGEQFPDYAIPARFFRIDAFPLKALSGKVDREALIKLVAAPMPGESTEITSLASQRASADAQQPPGEVLALCQQALQGEIGWDDDFVRWGAHSIAMARLTQMLRKEGFQVSVRELLTDFRTPRRVVDLPRTVPDDLVSDTGGKKEQESTGPAVPTAAGGTPINTTLFTALQAAGTVLLRAPLIVAAAALIAWGDPEDALLSRSTPLIAAYAVLGYLFLLMTPFLNLLWVRCLYVVLGKPSPEPGSYHRWSRHHLQTWWIDAQQRSVLHALRLWPRCAPVYAFLLRGLGAQIGHGTHISQHCEIRGPLTMVTIEDAVVIQSGVQINTLRWEGQSLTLKPLRLGAGAKLDQRSLVTAGATVGADAWLTPLSSPEQDVAVPAGALVDGVGLPAIGRHTHLQRPRQVLKPAVNRSLFEITALLAQLALESLLIVAPAALCFNAVVELLAMTGWVPSREQQETLLSLFQYFAVVGVAATYLTLLLTSTLTCLFLRLTRCSPGLISSRGPRGVLLRYRQQKMNQVQRLWTWTLTGQYLRRLAGANFGRTGASECDVMIDLVPEMLTTSPDVFMAHSCRTAVLDDHGDWLTLRPLTLGARSFLGNNSVAEAGSLPDDLLLGVSTPIGDHGFRHPQRNGPQQPLVVAGNPPLLFAPPEGHSEGAQVPSWGAFMLRFIIGDLVGIAVVPALPFLVIALLLLVFEQWFVGDFFASTLALLLAPVTLVLLAITVKNLLVPAHWGKHHAAPFWSLRHFTYFLAQDCFFKWAGPMLLNLGGTTLANPLLRAFGCRIGRGTTLQEPLQAFDWHAVYIGENCVMEGQLQLHSFEHRLLSVRETHIGSGSAVNVGATLLGGVTLAGGTTVSAQGLVMKGMHLQTGSHGGSPVSPESNP